MGVITRAVVKTGVIRGRVEATATSRQIQAYTGESQVAVINAAKVNASEEAALARALHRNLRYAATVDE